MLLKRRFVPKKIVATLNVSGYDYYHQKTCILMLYFSFNMLYISEARLGTVGHPASAMELFGTIHSFFFISNLVWPQSSKLLICSRFFEIESCLMVAQKFDQVSYICKEYSNFQDSKPIFMISDFKIFPKMLLRQLNFGAFGTFSCLLQRKNPLFFNLQSLLLLNNYCVKVFSNFAY